MAVPTMDDPAPLLKQADSLKTSNHAEFLQLMKRLGGEAAAFPPQHQMYLRYLQAWEVGYRGDYETATPLLNAVIAQSTDATLRFRAGTTLVNNLAIGSRYEDAFARISQLLDQLPRIADKDARIQALGVASMLYNEAGQYDLGLTYADQMLRENPVGDGDCKGRVFQVQSLYGSGKFATFDKQSREAIDACSKASELLYANGVRAHVANFDIEHGRSSEAIKLLQKHYAEVQHIGYPELTSDVDASLAQAYWNEGKVALAQQYAQAAIDGGVKHEFTKSLTSAYQLLYLINKKQGDLDAALSYHEKYMAADKGYLNEVSAKALAYQTVTQQVLAKKLQIDTLNKQNQILQLQQALSTKAMETNRLYIVLLLTVLASIALWAYRIKRSQMSFMKLARRDGLTGIFNRQHFVAMAEQQLKYCQKSTRVAGLIVIDLDNFKLVNDTHGHAVGDHILRRTVAACEAHLRSTDVFGRLGGEEFGILMPECDRDVVTGRAELIRLAIASVSNGEDAPGIEVSASFGVSSTVESGYNLRQLLIHADKALYDAKRGGRNRVVVFDDVEPSFARSDLPLQRR
ncbi:diguanylate cyclase (GGDEF)-like protein [Rhodanobacter sp. K2T2]|uniref:GGDEF domain-containing protein n=1 Tax=Rhodanobacter sp. K2T2 TaxID=2723085 RepID=UPI0017B0D293|nr:GGDEF domain-containing protein [Rhodanobacter sp. K2T2]NYE29584.1 diguanylate cyclase (GGDEF)-like protein [Rhodanobacter sp. K2T2]